jgi:FkbM family methyltransferase
VNAIKWIYPLGLRQRLAYRFVVRSRKWPSNPDEPHKLALAPASLTKLSRTDVAHRNIAWLGFYELTLSRQIAKLARRPGGLLVDVGANAGYYSCMWASLLPGNRCLAFEASPRNFAMLRENIVSAGLESQIDLFGVALGKTQGRMDFDPGSIEQTGWGGLSIVHTEDCLAVEVKRLDQVVPPDSQIEVLKIDTEGADAWVLEGAKALLHDKRIHHVFFECNFPRMKQLGIEPESPVSFLRNCGYHVRELAGGHSNKEFYACTD